MAEMQLPHKLSLEERQKLTVTGVTEVVSFDEEAVVLRTGLGSLIVQGRQLQLKQLLPDGGNVAILGQIEGLHYDEPRQTGNLLSRLFR